ncbi:hypothetical protein QTL86_11145 [Cellulosilyticum sp. ST5]|uniref:hypothetical protein n=1 Tax=Cellulosilyticum sp. ST5 TaxID=3055805 RepID=UPI003977DD9D
MKYVKFTLEQLVRVQDALGQWRESWEPIQDISVATSNKLYSTVTNDAVYRKYAPTGLTTFKAFEKCGAYRIVNNDTTYEVQSFNTDSRLTQLLLKEVVMSE